MQPTNDNGGNNNLNITNPAESSGSAPKDSISHQVMTFVKNENFSRFFRFGAVDQNVLLLGILTGVKIDSFIHRKFGVVGFGPIIGAGASNWIADSIATFPEGVHATAGITLGTLLPLVPIGVYMALRKNIEPKPPKLLVGIITGSIFAIFAFQYEKSLRRLLSRDFNRYPPNQQ
eukprot:TRINITY_DN3785_c0_g1_i1.p1 TRINITY_DN3785_c0_g1~~TRINITY_DN3785_c0_g1_i1.p1  ORF type:complete len:175 (-),score=26.70 TRINITY_DN3785_c0_g1_i1:68-592(-)